MEFRLLGEVELRAAGQMLDVGAPRLQAVLAALAVDAGRPVAIETLIDRVWGDDPPAEVRNVLYSYLSRNRRLLRQAATLTGGTARIERRHAGYVLDIDADLVDLHRFRRLVEQGSDRQRDDDARSGALAEALALWRGAPLAGLPGKWAAQVRDSWERRRLDAVVLWAQIELRLGRPAPVIATVPDLVAEYPLVEPLETLLMQALHAAGRGAEALDRYSAIRQRLADELGTDPGPELRALHQAVLHGELPPPSSDRDHAGLNPARVGKPQPLETSSGRVDAVPTDTPPRRTKSRPTHRRTVLAALAAVVAVILLASIGPALTFHRDKNNTSPSNSLSNSPSIERTRELFATAQRFYQDGKVKDAQTAIVDAIRLYGQLIQLNPDRNAPPLGPAIIQALARAGVDFSVAAKTLREWLANPVYTPYPAVSQVLLLQGWRLKAPVYLDVIVENYVQAPGMKSPRTIAEVRPDVLKTAILDGSNTRYGTQIADFEQLLKP